MFSCKTLFIVACVTICSIIGLLPVSRCCVNSLTFPSGDCVTLRSVDCVTLCLFVYRNVSTVDQRPAVRIITAHAYSVVLESAQSPSTSRA